tara:strand:+ start:105 stop:2801 length:2697 start_codon:yes stop_codon:yes gene_type:complete
MATYYVDYSGSAGTGDGSSFANRADKIKSIWSAAGNATLSSSDEIRVKGNPVTSLGTARIGDTTRIHQFARAIASFNVASTNIVYSTTTGETKFLVGASSDYGWVTGDRIMIVTDTAASAHSQPSLIGIHEITTDGTDYTSSFAIKINGYTATSNLTATSGNIYYVVVNGAIKLNTAGLFKNIACMDPGRSAWSTVSSAEAQASIESYNTSGWQSTTKSRWGGGSDKLTISAGGTGKKLWYQLPSALDLSGYQQVSFLVHCITSGYSDRSETPDTLRLCTDTNGDTSVHTIPIDLKGRYNTSSSPFWPVTVDLGVNLNTSIRSIALYREQSQSPVTFYIQNVVACKASSAADSITHSSCIGLKEANNPIWQDVDILWEDWVLPIAGCHQQTNHYAYYSNAGFYWSNSGSAVNVYKVEPFRVDFRGYSETYFDELRIRGDGNNVATATRTVSDCTDLKGSWSDNDMQTCSGDYATILHGDGTSRCWYVYSQCTDMNIENFFFHRWSDALTATSSARRNRFKNVGFLTSELDLYNKDTFGFDCNYFLAPQTSFGYYYSSQHINSSKNDFNWHLIMLADNQANTFRSYWSQGTVGEYRADKDQYGTIRVAGFMDTSPALYLRPSNSVVDIDNFIIHGGIPDAYVYFASPYGMTFNIGTQSSTNGHYLYNSHHTTIDQISITVPVNSQNSQSQPKMFGHSFAPVATGTSTYGSLVINGGQLSGTISNVSPVDMLIDSATHIGYVGISSTGGFVKWRNYQNTSGDHRTFLGNAIASPDTTVRHTASGTSLKIDITSGVQTSSYTIPLGKIVVNANSQVTVSVWTYATNTQEDMTLRVKRSDWMGLTSNQEVSITAGNYTANTWTQISKSFTPTESGVLDVELLTTGKNSTSDVYFDDFEVSQV